MTNATKNVKREEGSLWGIDMGGTKIEGVILKSVEDPQVLFRDRVPTEADQGYEHMLDQVKKIVDMMQGKVSGYKPDRIGFSTRACWIRN